MEEKYYYRKGNDFLIKNAPFKEDKIPEGYVQVSKQDYIDFENQQNSNFSFSIPPEVKIIEELKQQLAQTDYQAIKYAEGWLTEEQYAPIKTQRQALRNRINELEAVLNEQSL